MQAKKLTKENVIRLTIFCTALAFCLFTIVFFSILRDKGKAFMGFVSIIYVLIPGVAQKLFKFRIQTSLYPVIMLYTVSPLIGYSYELYYLLPWWDDVLHAFAGVVFAMLGAYLPKVMCKSDKVPLSLCLFCAFFFSVAISGLWELAEFSIDSLFGTDMQKDTILHSMRPSYLLSELLGGDTGELIPVDKVQILVNGEKTFKYIDVGLLDTMTDVFVETFGTLIYTVIYGVGRGKYFAFEACVNLQEEDPVSLPESLPVGAGVVAELAAAETAFEKQTTESADESAKEKTDEE